MWHSTYEHLCDEAIAADEEAEDAFEFMAARLMRAFPVALVKGASGHDWNSGNIDPTR